MAAEFFDTDRARFGWQYPGNHFDRMALEGLNESRSDLFGRRDVAAEDNGRESLTGQLFEGFDESVILGIFADFS